MECAYYFASLNGIDANRDILRMDALQTRDGLLTNRHPPEFVEVLATTPPVTN